MSQIENQNKRSSSSVKLRLASSMFWFRTYFYTFFIVETVFQSPNHSSHIACRWGCQLCSHALRGSWKDAVGVNSRHMNLVFAVQPFPQEERLFIPAFTHFHLKKTCMRACANEIFLLVSTHHHFPQPSSNMHVGGRRQKPGHGRISSAAPATFKSLVQKWFALSILDLLLASRVIIYLSYLFLKKMLHFQWFTHRGSVFLAPFALTAWHLTAGPPWTGFVTSPSILSQSVQVIHFTGLLVTGLVQNVFFCSFSFL